MNTIFHEHAMHTITEKFKCNCCNSFFEEGSEHIRCSKCNVDLCFTCYKLASSFQLLPIQEAIHRAYANPVYCQKMMDIYNASNSYEFSYSSNFVDQVIGRAHPRFYMFSEQKDIPNYELKATRIFTDAKGNHFAFFSALQAKKMIAKCNESIDKFTSSHGFVLKTSRFSDELQMELNHKKFEGFTKFSYYSKNFLSVLGFTISLGAGAYLEKAKYRPIFERAMSAARFKNALCKSSMCKFLGCICELDKDYNLRQSHLAERSLNVPDHNLNIRWDQPDSLTRILSVISEIRRQYPNLKMNGKDDELNILFSLVDYLDEGVESMLNNHSFNDETIKKIIIFTSCSIKDLQIYMRLEPKPFCILNTTSIPVYQTCELGDNMNHSILTQEQFTKINKSLVPDLREELSRRNPEYTTIDLDPTNIKPSMLFIDSLITSAEIKLAQTIGELANELEKYGKDAYKMVKDIADNYFKVSSFIQLAIPNNNEPVKETAQCKPNCIKDISKEDCQNQPNKNDDYCQTQSCESTEEKKEIAQSNGSLEQKNDTTQSQLAENIPTQSNNLSDMKRENAQKKVSQFVENSWGPIELKINQLLKENIIPDIYSDILTPLKRDVSQLKHLKELIFLSAEIERRKNDDYSLFNVDLGIEDNPTYIHKYNIHMII